MFEKKQKLARCLPVLVVIFALACFAISSHAAVEEVILKNVQKDPRDLCAFLQLIVNIKNLALMVGGPITVLMIIIGGIWMSTASGIESRITKAKQIITSGIVGLVFVVCAWLIVSGIITALFGPSLGNAWWTIKGCTAIDTSTPYTGDNNDEKPSGDPSKATDSLECRDACSPLAYIWDEEEKTCTCVKDEKPSGDPSKATNFFECRDACSPLSQIWDEEEKTCTCVKGEKDPRKATNAKNCAIACLPKRSYWNDERKYCLCQGQGSLNYDPNAAAERLGRTGRAFFNCIESFYLYPDEATIWRVGDHNFDCYDEDKWSEEGCIFEKYSCHYGGRNCRGESYAVDFTNITNKTLYESPTSLRSGFRISQTASLFAPNPFLLDPECIS